MDVLWDARSACDLTNLRARIQQNIREELLHATGLQVAQLDIAVEGSTCDLRESSETQIHRTRHRRPGGLLWMRLGFGHMIFIAFCAFVGWLVHGIAQGELDVYRIFDSLRRK